MLYKQRTVDMYLVLEMEDQVVTIRYFASEDVKMLLAWDRLARSSLTPEPPSPKPKAGGMIATVCDHREASGRSPPGSYRRLSAPRVTTSDVRQESIFALLRPLKCLPRLSYLRIPDRRKRPPPSWPGSRKITRLLHPSRFGFPTSPILWHRPTLLKNHRWSFSNSRHSIQGLRTRSLLYGEHA